MSTNTDTGIFDATDRIMSEVLKNTELKNTFRILMNSIDQDASPRLAKTLVWQDMETSFASVAAIPPILNSFIRLMDEALGQVLEKIPEPLLSGYIEDLVKDIDLEALKTLKENTSSVVEILQTAVQNYVSVIDEPRSDTNDKTTEKVTRESHTSVKSRDTIHPVFPDGHHMGYENTSDESSVVKEILKTNFIKQILIQHLNSVDPENGKKMARILIWEDMTVAFSLVSALPRIVNWHIAALREIAAQLNEKIPPQLLGDYVLEAVREIDMDGAKECFRQYVDILKGINDHFPSHIFSIADTFDTTAIAQKIGSGINMSLKHLNDTEERNPGFLSDFLSEVVSKVDKKEFQQAAINLTSAVLDQKPSFISIGWYFVKEKIRRLFKGRQSNHPDA